MAKITDLLAVDLISGDEFLPIVQGGVTKRAKMSALRALIVPFLQYWYKGDTGNTGPANSTYTTLAALRAAPVTHASYIFVPPSGSDGGVPAGVFSYQTYQAPYSEDANTVALAAVPLTVGALKRQGATAVDFDGRSADAKLRETISVTDPRFAGGAKGNGVADDSPAFQAAIDEIRRIGGGKVRVPGTGPYMLDTPIRICDDLEIDFGVARIIVGKSFAGINNPLFKNFVGPSFSSPGARTAQRNFVARGGIFDGQSPGGAAGTLIPNAQMRGAIFCIGGWEDGTGMSGVQFLGMEMGNFAGSGIMVWKSTNVRLANSKGYNFFPNETLSIGSFFDFHEVHKVWIDNIEAYHTAPGLSWHGGCILDWDHGSSKVWVSNSYIHDMNGGDGISCEGNNLDNLDGGVFTNVTILGCAGQGLGVDRCVDIAIYGGSIQKVIGPAVLATNTQTLTVDKLRIKGTSLGGIMSAAGTKLATIKGCVVQDVNYYDLEYRGHGIELIDNSASPGTIYDLDGNVISDTDGANINVYAANVSIRGGQLLNAGRNLPATGLIPGGQLPPGGQLADMQRASIVASDGAKVSSVKIVPGPTTRYAVSSGPSAFPTIENLTIADGFTLGHFYIGYRRDVYVNLSATILDAKYNAELNVFSGKFGGTPPGYWCAGDRMERHPPVAGQPEGVRCVTAGTDGWKPYGSIGA